MTTTHNSSEDSSHNNRLVEELPASFLCVTRKLQDKPYEPVLPSDISHCVAQQMSMRPPPFVAQDTLFEFYSILQGHCNVPSLQVPSIELFSSGPGGSGAPGAPSAGCGVNGSVAAGGAAGSSSLGVLGVAPPGGVFLPGGVAAPPQFHSGDGESYRLAQIRQNERHVNSKSARVCSYFNTREGCRRGPNCPFIHVSGTVV